MPGLTWLASRRVWRVQRAVPKHLQPLVGAALWQRQLGDVRERAARDAASAAWAEWSNLIAWLEALPDDERERLAKARVRAYRRKPGMGGAVERLKARMKDVPENRYLGLIRESLSPYLTTVDLKGLDAWRALNRRDNELANLLRFAAAELRADPDEPRALQAETLLAREQATTALEQMEPVITKRDRLEAMLDGDKSKTLDGLVDLYAKANAPTAETVKAVRRYMQRFIAVVGDIDPRHVQPADVRKFRDAMEEAGNTPKNSDKMLSKLRMAFAIGVDEGRCDSNPFLNIKVHGKIVDDEGGHLRWEASQLRTIFNRVGERDEQVAIATKMLIYSGKRPNEVCQLRCDDIKCMDGVDLFHVTNKGPLQSLKVGTRPHDVPLHPHIREEVLAYVQRRRDAGKDRLFDFTYRASVKFAHYYGERFNKWARRVTGSNDMRQSAYSFRHSWEDALRNADVPETVRRQLAGRAPDKGSAGGYGRGSDIKVLARWMKRVDPLRKPGAR